MEWPDGGSGFGGYGIGGGGVHTLFPWDRGCTVNGGPLCIGAARLFAGAGLSGGRGLLSGVIPKWDTRGGVAYV